MDPLAHFGSEHISDLAVHPSSAEILVAAAVDGGVHQYSHFLRERSWKSTTTNPRVCWADDKVLVWGAQAQGWVLSPDGSSSPFETFENSDLAVAGGRLVIASRSAGLFSFQLSEGQPVLRERIRQLDHYLERSLVASALGAVAFVDAGRIQFQCRADAEWQAVEAPCRAIYFSRDGRKLAIVQARGEGSQLAILKVVDDGSLDVKRHTPTFPVLAHTVVSVDWSLDGSSVLVIGADGELEVRDVSTFQLAFSAHVRGMSRFYAADDVIVTGDPKGLHSIRWKPAVSNLWIRRRNGSVAPEKLELIGSQNLSRGDEVLLFVDYPILRPAAIYEVINGRRSHEDEGVQTPATINAKLRVLLPPPNGDDLAVYQDSVASLAKATPLHDTRSLRIHDDAVRLLRCLYPPESATGSQIHQFLQPIDISSSKAEHIPKPLASLSMPSPEKATPALVATTHADSIASQRASSEQLGTAEGNAQSPSVLTDRQAAEIRASKSTSEFHANIMRFVAATPSNRKMSLHDALTDAARNLAKRLVEIYSQLPEATQRIKRDELVTVIQDRVADFIESSIAIPGAGSAGVTQMAANLIASQRMGIPAEFDLAVYDAVKSSRFAAGTAENSEVALPDRVGPWSVLGKLGDGGQATAYLVIHDGDPTKTKRVLKVLKPWSSQSKAASESIQRIRFSREATALKDLTRDGCPDIVSVLEDNLSPASGQPWYAMPFYAGPLNKRFDEFKGNVDRVLVVAETIASTLAWMHEHEPLHVHRDVHAGNIFFEPESDRAKLGDFGLVHVGEEREAGQLISTALEEFGPWQWRPPELHKGSTNRHDPMSDVYLLGGVIYGALTGGQFIEETEQGRVFAHETPALSIARFSNDPRVPHVSTLLKYMLARDPSARLSAARIAELCAEIRRWRPTEPSPVTIPSHEKVAAAAARLRARGETSRRVARMQELTDVCSRVQAKLTLTPGPSRPYEAHRSVSLDTNQYPRQLDDGSILQFRALLHVRVGFGPEPKVVLDSYVELGAMADMRLIIAVKLFDGSDFEPVGSFLESDPEAENQLYRTVEAQLDDLNHRLAVILEGA